MRIEWTEPAVDDLTGIREHIAQDSKLNATRFLGRLIRAVDKLATLPASGRRVPEAADRQDVREILFQSYRILYRATPDTIQILAVLHGSRDLSLWEHKPWERR